MPMFSRACLDSVRIVTWFDHLRLKYTFPVISECFGITFG